MHIIRSIFLSIALGFSVVAIAEVTNLSGKDSDCSATEDVKIVVADYDLDDEGESELSGKIVNRSSDDEYNGVQLKLDFWDDDGQRLGSQVVTLDTQLNESQTEDFLVKFNAPEDTERLTYDVLCAVEE